MRAPHQMAPAEPNLPDRDAPRGRSLREYFSRPFVAAMGWVERIDPGVHRRIKGLRLVTSYGIAAMLGTLQGGASLGSLAGGFALWACVSEARASRAKSSRDLVLLTAAAAVGAAIMIGLAPLLSGAGRPGAELTLASGAFLVGYLKPFGVLGPGIGSQIYIGQLLAYGAGLAAAALAMVIYAMALPERYDIACGAFAFTLIVTLAVTGEHSPLLLAARAWETLIGGALGLAAAMLVFPLRPLGSARK